MNTFYSIKKFSELSRLTIKTLHYYDQIGLLVPNIRDKFTNYRMYTKLDLLKTKQIIVLKFIGLNLNQIKSIVISNQMKVTDGLELQKAALKSLQEKISKSLTLINEMLNNPNINYNVDWQNLADIAEGVSMQNVFDYEKWTENNFSKIELQQWQKMNSKHPPEFWVEYNAKWNELFKKAELMLNLKPNDHKVQVFCKEWMSLVDVVYKDYPILSRKIWEGMKSGIDFKMGRPFNKSIIDFMGKALEIYHKK